MAGEDAAYCRRLLMLSCSGCGGRANVVHHMTGAGGGKRSGGDDRPRDNFGSGKADEYDETYGGFNEDDIPF